jgi:hypothetical protein
MDREHIDDLIERHGIPRGPGPKRSQMHMQSVLDHIAGAWARHPEYRLCQLLSNAVGSGPQDLFHVEDDVLIGKLAQSALTSTDDAPAASANWTSEVIKAIERDPSLLRKVGRRPSDDAPTDANGKRLNIALHRLLGVKEDCLHGCTHVIAEEWTALGLASVAYRATRRQLAADSGSAADE